MRTKKNFSLQKKITKKRETRRTFRKKVNHKKVKKQNTKNYNKRNNKRYTRKKKGGMEEPSSHESISVRPQDSMISAENIISDLHESISVRPQDSMISAENIILDLHDSFPKVGSIFMSRQYSCSEDAVMQKLKTHPRDAKVLLNPNGKITITWGGDRIGTRRVKTITGVQDGVISYTSEDTGINEEYYVGMVLMVNNEGQRPWFSSHSSNDGCQFICQRIGRNEKLALIEKFQRYSLTLRELISNWRNMEPHDREEVIKSVQNLTSRGVTSGNPAMRALLRSGEFSLNVIGGAIVFMLN